MAVLAPVRSVTGRGVVIAGDDIDTDRIIPARFLRCVTFDDLAEGLFRDERVDDDGRQVGHPLDRPEHAGATVMISGRNFCCGSSREHAPQSIARAGFRAVIAGSFAEIFFGNATTLGLVCLALDDDALAALAAAVRASPEAELEIDVERASVRVGDASFQGRIPDTARSALLAGRYDPLADLLAGDEAIAAVAASLPYVRGGGGAR
jgi:3-isopropylmalate/(R)-2-methylmalate dehydratase small subunit